MPKSPNQVMADAANQNKKEAIKAIAIFVAAHVVIPIVVVTAAGVIARKLNDANPK